MEEIEYKPLSYAEAVAKMKICVLANAGFHLRHISCMDCGAKPLCMKYADDKYIYKYSYKCGNSSETSEICKSKEEKQMSEMTKVNISTDKDGNETWEVDVEGSIPKAIVLGKIHQSIITAEKEFCSETPTVVINGQSTINPRHYAIMDKLATLKDLEKYILGY